MTLFSCLIFLISAHQLSPLSWPAYVEPPQRPSYPEACGLRHLAFKVSHIEEVVKDLEEKGISCQPIRRDTFTGEKMTFFEDPDGLPLELHE